MSPLTPNPLMPWTSRAMPQDLAAYWVDAWQRSVLFWDTLRERGNVYTEHAQSGKPPVLVFDYDTVLDARQFELPANYALLHIKAPKGQPAIAGKRAFVVIDPRAGHGPGIGGFKMDSEIGVALAAGHPCYFVTFFPDPVPGQTIGAVARAEVQFLEKVKALHPDAEGDPFVIGNCQGGWALVMLAAARPDLVGPILLAGSPVSYWAGVRGKNPMRYSGGLLGGSWLASLTGDLGHGKFDGAHLVSNFEQLNPSNTYWSKLYDLYTNVDTGRDRFLEFERWWGGHFLMNKEEMEWIVQNLFVGNKLSRGGVSAADGSVKIDLRNIRSPIVVFASWGDNITPPQQALNWIADLYDNVEQIRAQEQTIVYCLHEKIGHLGIFVSASVAKKETAEITGTLDLIDTLPPGLYELEIQDTRPDMANLDLIEGRYVSVFHPREVSDILALDDGRDDEEAFAVAARVAEINQAAYDRFLSPLVKATSTEASAQLQRTLNPARMERWLISDLNPAMAPLKWLAEAVRAQRQQVAADNPYSVAERALSAKIENSLDAYRDKRDAMQEQLFMAIYQSPWLAAALGLGGKPATLAKAAALAPRLNPADIEACFEQGSPLDAAMRMLIYVGSDGSGIDERPFVMIQRLMKASGGRLTLPALKHAAKMHSLVLMVDEARALAALPKLLPDPADARLALARVREIASAKGELDAGRQARLAKLQALLAVADVPAPAPAKVTSAEVAVAPAPAAESAPVAAPAKAPATRAAKAPAPMVSKVKTPAAAPVEAPVKAAAKSAIKPEAKTSAKPAAKTPARKTRRTGTAV